MEIEDRELGYRYTTSLHWSLTQFTPSSMEIFPRNSIERTYSIVVLFTALVVFSSFVSSITSAMTQLHQSNRFKSKQREDIRRYISDNKLSLELGNRIVAFVRKHRAGSRKRVHEQEIEILKVLPESLRVQLHWEVYEPVLRPHPFFFNSLEVDEGGVLDICHHALSEMSLGSSQELFTPCQPATKMYFVVSGVLEYFHGSSDTEMAEISRGQWCVEAALWIKWDHEGRLAAVSHCELVVLDASTFRKFMTYRTGLMRCSQEYARLFKERVDSGNIDRPLDVWFDHDATTEMAQLSFGKLRGLMEQQDRSVAPRRKWRPWRTLSLIRQKSPPALTSPQRSNSLP